MTVRVVRVSLDGDETYVPGTAEATAAKAATATREYCILMVGRITN